KAWRSFRPAGCSKSLGLELCLESVCKAAKYTGSLLKLRGGKMSRYCVHRVRYARVIPSFVLTMVALGLLSYGFAAALPQTKTVATGAKAKAKGRIVQREE